MDPPAFGQEFRPNAMPIAFQVDDVEEARAKLVEAGVEFKTDTFDSGSVTRRYSSTRPGTPLDLHHPLRAPEARRRRGVK
jgi:hypothetical protein